MINKIINCAKSIIYNFKNNNLYMNLKILSTEIKVKKKCDNETYYAELFDYKYDMTFILGIESKNKSEVVKKAKMFLNELGSDSHLNDKINTRANIDINLNNILT